MKLVIVESPSKIKTIERYLSADYKVMASFGHVADLSTKGIGRLGIDLKTFAGDYAITPGKTKVVNELKKAKEESDEVLLATDPDREGEAIAYHIAKILNIDPKTTKRLAFHEITKDGILSALAEPSHIDLALFDSQETRRMLDRIVGFKLSGLLKSKIKVQSAGRVQSAVLKLIIDKENEIKAFIPVEYWTMKAETSAQNQEFSVNFKKSKRGKTSIDNALEKDEILSSLTPNLTVIEVTSELRKSSAKPPFTTSALQQEIGAKYRYSASKTARIAQKLYEGVAIDGVETGLVTYIRTDSTRLSASFINHASTFIINSFGKEYLSARPAMGKAKGNVQDAHEAIRPTDLSLTPQRVAPFLTKEEANVYGFIYARAVASLMTPSSEEVTKYTFESNANLFSASSTELKFPGYRAIYGAFENKSEGNLPSLKKGEILPIKDVKTEQKFTEPPARFSEGRLIKTMEEVGIGRPSTYAPTIETLQKRKYITISKGMITPTESGFRSIEALDEYFPALISSDYTAAMETELDKIAAKESDKVKFLTAFYHEFSEQVVHAQKKMPKIQAEKVGRTCPNCGGELVYRDGKFGRFIACANFPKCKYVENIADYTGEACPKCGKPLVYRHDAKGQKYIRCSDYKVCDYALSLRRVKRKKQD